MPFFKTTHQSGVSRLMTILLSLLTALVFLTALAETIVSGITLHRFYTYRYQDVPYIPTSTSVGPFEALYAPVPKTKTPVLYSEVAAGVCGLVAAILALFATISLPLLGKPRRRWVAGACATGLTVLSLVVMGLFAYVFAASDSEPTIFVDSFPGIPGESSGGWEVAWSSDTASNDMTWEHWTCTLAPYAKDDVYYNNGKWWSKSCALNTASRWTLLPEFLLCLLASFAAIVAVEEARKRSTEVTKKPDQAAEMDPYRA